MARDGLLPEKLASVHPRYRTPHVVTLITGVGATIAAAILPVGKLAEFSNSRTLIAFKMVALSILVLRRTDPHRHRPFRTPAVWLVAPLAIIGCIVLYFSLPWLAILVLPVWGAIGLLLYFGYSRSRSHLGRGHVEVHEGEPGEPPMPGTAQ
jgi:APA family basic amino acid/polyamine antiporter